MELYDGLNPLELLQPQQVELLSVTNSLSMLRKVIQEREDVSLELDDEYVMVVKYQNGLLKIFDKSTALMVADILPGDKERSVLVYLYEFDKVQDLLTSMLVPAIVVEFDESLKATRVNHGSVFIEPEGDFSSRLYLMQGDELPPIGRDILAAKRIAESIKKHVLEN